MKLNKKIIILIMFIGVVSLFGAYSATITDDIGFMSPDNNDTDIGCCSIVLQLDGNDTLMSHRRDSNLDADIHIENVDWHGYKVIKQYKTDNKYFCHVIITSDGWVIGQGGIDDGPDNEKVENISASMINKDNSISTADLEKIQNIKKPYGRGHFIIKAPNGNYGFATIDKVKTGKLEPGQYISLPNNYSLSRTGNVSIDGKDKIEVMNNLSRTDLYGDGRREIVVYDFKDVDNKNSTDIFVSNEDGAYVGVDNTKFIDNIYVNNDLTKGSDIPIAPAYKQIGSMTFDGDGNIFSSLPSIVKIIVFIAIAGILFFIVIKFVKFRRKNY